MTQKNAKFKINTSQFQCSTIKRQHYAHVNISPKHGVNKIVSKPVARRRVALVTYTRTDIYCCTSIFTVVVKHEGRTLVVCMN